MSYLILNIIGFLISIVVALVSALFLMKNKGRNILAVIALSALTVFPGYIAWHCGKGIINGDLYEDETRTFLKEQLEGTATGSTAIKAMYVGYKAYDFKLESIEVKNIWHGKSLFNGNKLPYNLYEVNTVWNNRAKGQKLPRCFLYAWSNDTENDYRRDIQVFNACDKQSEIIKELKTVKN